jgi:preprotein translocase SecE subunit
VSAIFKPGQGYWTRVMSAIGFGLVAIMGADWVRKQLINVRIGSVQPEIVQWGVFVLIAAVAGAFIYRFIGVHARTVDFLIATEGEMKKVNWSTRREVLGMTWVVIGLTIFIGAFVFVLDYILFSPAMQAMGVLDAG